MDPQQFLSDLSSMGDLLGLGDGAGSSEAAAVLAGSGGQFGGQQSKPAPKPKQAPPKAPAASEPKPEYSFAENGADGTTVLRVELPELEALGQTSLDVSDEGLRLHAPGLYLLDLRWPKPVLADGAKAKFQKKSRTLQVTLPLRDGAVAVD